MDVNLAASFRKVDKCANIKKFLYTTALPETLAPMTFSSKKNIGPVSTYSYCDQFANYITLLNINKKEDGPAYT